MIRLTLNGLDAVIKSDFSIKLTSTGRASAKESSHTYEVSLPLGCAQNRSIFGTLGRLDSTPALKPMPATLFDGSAPLLSGIAKITSVSKGEVKIQLLAGNAAYAEECSASGLYLDSLDMGTWMQAYAEYAAPLSSFPRPGEDADPLYGSEAEGTPSGNYVDCAFRAMGWPQPLYSRAFYRQVFDTLSASEIPFRAFPTFNTTNGEMTNTVTAQHYGVTGGDARDSFRVMLDYPPDKNRPTQRDRIPRAVTVSMQPHLWFIAEAVAKATGFQLPRTANGLYTHPLYKRLVYANTSNSPLIGKCMPHWSVADFWEYVAQAFGLVLNVDYVTHTATLADRVQSYDINNPGTQRVWLKYVDDAYTIDCSESQTTDISVSNTAFADHEDTPGESLPYWARNQAVTKDGFADIQSLYAWFTDPANAGESTRKDVLYKTRDGRCFAYFEDVEQPAVTLRRPQDKTTCGLVEVDWMRPRILDEDRPEDTDIELRFVPAPIEWHPTPMPSPVLYHSETGGIVLFSYGGTDGGIHPFPTSGTYGEEFPSPMLTVPGVKHSVTSLDDVETLDIEAVAYDEQDDGFSSSGIPDVMYIAIADFNGASTIPAFSIDYPHYPNGAESNPYLRQLEGFIPYTHITQSIVKNEGVWGYGASDYSNPVPYSLTLNGMKGKTTLFSPLEHGIKTDTTKVLCAKFHLEKVPDPDALFYINSRPYLCLRIESTVTPAGVGKVHTGYFCPIG